MPNLDSRKALKNLILRLGEADMPKAHHEADWHMTLAFLGRMTEGQVTDLIKDLDNLNIGNIGPIRWAAEAFGGFPEADSPKVWALQGLADESLQALWGQVWACSMVQQHGLEPPTFRPHISLSRSRLPKAIHRLDKDDLGKVRFEEICLIASETQGEGPRYRIIKAWPLISG